MQTPTKKPRPVEREAASENARINFKRFPAYGRELDEIRKRGQIPRRYVIVCFDWEIGKLFPRIVVAREHPPARLELRYLAGLHVQIVYYDKEADYVPALVDEILRIHPATLSVFSMSAVARGEPAFQMLYREGWHDI